jgi:hypothetical protein
MSSSARPARVGRLFVAALVLSVMSCTSPKVSDEDMLRGQVMLSPFKSELMAALTTAVTRDPVEAIGVCMVKAPQIATEIAQGNGVRVGRTSHKLRNPANSPSGWNHRWLRHYLENPDDQDPHAEYIGPETIGYVEPIFVKPMCLTCHGQTIAPEIEEKIAELYPKDQARGFEAGDFRGIFWLEMPAQ